MNDPIFRQRFTVPTDAIDGNGHVNNVHFVQWMQDAAVAHYSAMGGLAPTQALGATWVVRSHQVVYLNPAFVGDEVEVRTWVVNLRKVRSLRSYQFVRVSDAKVLVTGETEWVFVHAVSGNLLAIPAEISSLFSLHEE